MTRRNWHPGPMVLLTLLLGVGLLVTSRAVMVHPTGDLSTRTPTLTATPPATFMPSVSEPATKQGQYFVDTAKGSDTNPGTSRDKAWKTIQQAANSVSAGATINVLAGDYPERVRMKTSGSSGKMIAFLAEGNVTMDGFTVLADYVRISGFDISNTPDDYSEGWGIYYKGGYCLIENNYIHFATHGGLTLRAGVSDADPTHDCVVRNNKFYRNSQVGIEVYGNNNLVEGNEILGTIQYHPAWKNPPDWVDADGISFFGSGHVIRDNYIHDISYSDPYNKDPHIDCFQSFSDSGHLPASNVLLEGNLCENAVMKSKSAFGKGFMIEGGASNVAIRNNVIDAFCGLFSKNSTSLIIENNTFASDISFPPDYGPEGIHLSDTIDAVVKNNIFYNFPSYSLHLDAGSTYGVDIGYNLIYRTDNSPSGSSLPEETTSPTDLRQINPEFIDADHGDFHLRANSPAIDAGKNLTDNPEDFDDIPRPQMGIFDIGAYEFHSWNKTAPDWAGPTDEIVNTIAVMGNGGPITVRDPLPTQENYLDSSTTCEGNLAFLPAERTLSFTGNPPAHRGCVIQIRVKLDAPPGTAVVNTATIYQSQATNTAAAKTMIRSGTSGTFDRVGALFAFFVGVLPAGRLSGPPTYNLLYQNPPAHRA